MQRPHQITGALTDLPSAGDQSEVGTLEKRQTYLGRIVARLISDAVRR
jgi:hypothetical protein